MTGAFVAILGAVVLFTDDAIGSLVTVGIGLAVLAFSVRGYTVTDSELLVHRLGWATRFDLRKLREATFEPGAMTGSVRTLGIGGVFGFAGRFRNASLGAYRAYATDGARTVVLDFGDTTVVVTPDRPAAFVEALRQHA